MKRLDFAPAIAVAALSLAFLVAAGAIGAARANQADGGGVALAYDSATNTLLKAYGGTLYRSNDEGQNWQQVELPSLREGRLGSVAPSPAIAGMIYFAGPGLGVFQTKDGGKTWVDRSEGLPSGEVRALAAHTTQPDTLYAFVRESGVYRSQNAGKSWRLMDKGPQEGMAQLIHSDMAGSMQTGWLFAATPKGIRRIMNCFCLWQDAGKLGSDAHSVTYDPRQPDQIYVATEKGPFRTRTAAKTGFR